MSGDMNRSMIQAFEGEGDLVAWLCKVKLVAKLKKISDLASFIPLYLEGDALKIYLELSESEQASAARIEARLKEAFTDSPFVAYGKVVRLKWAGEPVDVYANEIKRLAGLAGFSGEGLDRLVKLTFVNGFPDSVSIELMKMEDISTNSMSAVLARARILAPGKTSAVAAAALKGKADFGSGTRFGESWSFKGQCYRCGGPHMIRNCPKDTKERRIVCYRCGKEGHIASRCFAEPGKGKDGGDSGEVRKSVQGNDERGAAAPAVTL